MYVITAMVIIAGIILFLWLNSGGYETTDNAQLDGNIVTLKSRVSSTVDQIYFQDNQYVKKGDTLIKLNNEELEAKVLQAKAALLSAQSGVLTVGKMVTASFENATASQRLVNSNRQEITAALSNLNVAKDEMERASRLLEIKGITQQDYNAIKNRFELAKAEHAQAIDKLESSRSSANGQNTSAESDREQIGSAKALVEQKKAELKLAEYELSHAFIISPCSGTVVKRTVQTGNLVSNGQNLCAIVDSQSIWVTANVKESQLKSIKIGQEVTIKIDAYPNVELAGKVSSFGGATGAKFSLLPPDNATGNFVKIVQRVPIRIILDKESLTDKETPLFPGLSASVKIKTK